MTKEEVLQRANEYCNERSYDGETLTDEFKDKFAEFYAKRYEDKGIDDEGVLDDIKFNLDTAKSAAAEGITKKQKSFESRESDYKNKIAELNKKIKKPEQKQEQKQELPEEVKQQLKELQDYKDEKVKKDKFANIVKMAKKEIREDFHNSFDEFASDYDVVIDDEDEEQAKYLVKRFKSIFKDSIGDIKPLAPKVQQKRDEDFISQIPKVKVQ
jgi:hypothetical protein